MDKKLWKRICYTCHKEFLSNSCNKMNCGQPIKTCCKTCGKNITYLCGERPKEYCSSRCANRDPSIKERIKNTQKERYGDYGFNTEKSRQTLLEKYGVDNCMKNETIKQKTRKTQYEKYGQFAFNTDEGKEKARINSHTDISNQLRRQSILETIKEADQEQIMKIRGQCISKKTQAVKERIKELTNISFDYEVVCGDHVYDLGYKKLLIEVNPTESHNITVPFKEIVNNHTKIDDPLTKYEHITRQHDAEDKGYELVQIFDFTNQWEDIVVNKLVKLGYLDAECKNIKEIRSDKPNCHIVKLSSKYPQVEVYDAGIIYIVEKCEEPIKKLTKIDKVQDSYDVETASDRFILDGIYSGNCRTRVIGNVLKNNEIYVGRGNFSFTTINLPRLGIEAKGDWDKFYKDFDHMIDLAKDQLLDRFEMISHKHVYNYPFLMQQGVWIDSDNLDLNDEIGEVLKNASISIGFIGLAECLKAMTGKHHGESEEAYQKGLEIIQHLRNKTDSFTKQYNLNFSTFASPAEGLCLAGDTLVQTSNGNVPIKDVKVGDLVLTLNEVTRKVELKKVLKSGMTFEKAKVMKISFDDGSSLVCTPNHPIMVRKGVYRDDKGCFTSNGMTNEDIQWVEAKDLFIGARIKSNNLILDDSKHIRVRNGERIHRMVYEYYSGKKIPNGYEIHHINENKTDNRFENLQLIKISDHRRLHMKDTIKKYCFTSESVKGEKNPFYGKQHSQETLKRISFTRRMNNFIKKISDDELVKMFYSGTTINNICDNFKAKIDIVESRLKKLGVSLEPNHIVTSIEYLDEEIPVYDLTVEDNHNFYVGGNHGILVHNSGRFTRLDKKRYGIIEGVTDREYYTNSFHIPVYFKIPAYKKMQLEGKFHELCNAGAITYIEMDGNLTKNVQAFEDIVKYAGECGISYFSINHAVDRCPICGYTGIIGDECPRCGFREGVGVSLEQLKKRGLEKLCCLKGI